MTEIDDAYKIAARDLRRCYDKKGIYAGRRHFHDYWSRDGFYACLGANRLKDFDIVKKNLQNFIHYQRPNGQLPLRIGQYYQLLNFLGANNYKECARYTSDKSGAISTDQNSLFIIAIHDYFNKTGDRKLIKEHFGCILKAIEWNLEKHSNGGPLLEEGYFASWADSVKKSGMVLYTNVLHFEALKLTSELCLEFNKKAEAKKYKELSLKVKGRINDLFWNGEYYIDWIKKKKFNFFSTDGNLLAIVFGIADKEKAKSIQNCMKKFKINEPVPSKTNYPKYFPHMVSTWLRLVRMGDYHNDSLGWLWIGCFDAIAKHKLGMKRESLEVLTSIAKKINEYGEVYEVYTKKGKPVWRILYRAEHPFAWSSAMFVYACNETRALRGRSNI